MTIEDFSVTIRDALLRMTAALSADLTREHTATLTMLRESRVEMDRVVRRL